MAVVHKVGGNRACQRADLLGDSDISMTARDVHNHRLMDDIGTELVTRLLLLRCPGRVMDRALVAAPYLARIHRWRRICAYATSA